MMWQILKIEGYVLDFNIFTALSYFHLTWSCDAHAQSSIFVSLSQESYIYQTTWLLQEQIDFLYAFSRKNVSLFVVGSNISFYQFQNSSFFQMLDDFVDVTKDEKLMMHMWNSFVRKQRYVLSLFSTCDFEVLQYTNIESHRMCLWIILHELQLDNIRFQCSLSITFKIYAEY